MFDVMVGCGLCALPLALLSHWAGARADSMAGIVVAALAVLVNGPHYAATAVRAWVLGGRHRHLLLLSSVVAVAVVVAAHGFPVLLAWLFTAYVSISPWHYATQNHGVGLVLLARDGCPAAAAPTTGERRALKLAHVLLAMAAVVAIHVGAREPLVLRVGIAAGLAAPIAVVAIIASVLLTMGVVRRLRRRGANRRGLWLVATLLSTSLSWFAVPALLARGGSLVYVSGVTALLHGAQYLWITNFAAARTAFVQKRSFDGVAWMGLVTGLGVVLFTLGPWVLSRGFGYDLIISLLIFQAVVNLHHFVVDASIWKLRDQAVREPICAGRERPSSGRGQVSNLRAMVWSVPVFALVFVGLVDVFQLAATRESASDTLRAQALLLNENDSRLWLRQAQAAAVDGDVDGAKADLARALALSPWNADAQRALARLHVFQGRDDEAWERYLALPKFFVYDGSALQLFAGVALRLGKLDEAEALGRQALLELNHAGFPAEVEARSTLGQTLLKAGKNAEARTELKRALDESEAALGYDPLRTGQLLDAGIALAHANEGLAQTDAALMLFARALEGARVVNRPAIAFHALTGRAAVFDGRKDHGQALQAFQAALRFADDVKDDPERVAHAWLDYASLLARSDSSMRLRYACALKGRRAAERMAASKGKDELLSFVTEATRFVQEALAPNEAEEVRKDIDAVVAESFFLTYPDQNDDDDDSSPAPHPGGP